MMNEEPIVIVNDLDEGWVRLRIPDRLYMATQPGYMNITMTEATLDRLKEAIRLDDTPSTNPCARRTAEGTCPDHPHHTQRPRR